MFIKPFPTLPMMPGACYKQFSRKPLVNSVIAMLMPERWRS